MLTTRQTEREEQTGSAPTHTTSLSKKERRLIRQLCRYEKDAAWSHIHDHEMKKQLYRFAYYFPPPDHKRWPRAWSTASRRGGPDALLSNALDKARYLLSRPDTLTPIQSPSITPAPTALPQIQSPLLSKIPPEVRTRIFEFAVTFVHAK